MSKIKNVPKTKREVLLSKFDDHYWNGLKEEKSLIRKHFETIIDAALKDLEALESSVSDITELLKEMRGFLEMLCIGDIPILRDKKKELLEAIHNLITKGKG